MKDDSQLIWEAMDREKELSVLRASLDRGKLGIILTDLFRENPEEAADESLPVKVTFANLQRPLVRELDDGTRVPNFVRHWSQQPGEKSTREAYGTSIQNAMMYDSPVATAADNIGPETNVPQTMSTIIINVERDAKFAENIKHKQAMANSVTQDFKKYKFD